MRLFVSAGEASGDLHGASLLNALRRRRPDLEVHGFGGERMEQAGCRIHYPLTDLAGVGLMHLFSTVRRVPGVLKLADRVFRTTRPDALVLIDFPGFHWWLAKCAKKHGIPVVWFVPPQLWAWAQYRVKWMRRLADHVLCTLPFEEQWYRERGVDAQFIGHPYFDELHLRRPDEAFLAAQRAKPGTVVALLPGSRRHEIRHNLDAMVRSAGIIHARRPDVRFLVACLRPEQARNVQDRLHGCTLPIEVHAGRTAEILRLAHSAIAKSGSVGLELLFHGKPAVVGYQLHWIESLGSHHPQMSLHQSGESAGGKSSVPRILDLPAAGRNHGRPRPALAGRPGGLPGSPGRIGRVARPRGRAGRLRPRRGGHPGSAVRRREVAAGGMKHTVRS